MDELLITVAPTGAETAKADCPQLPTTPEEIARTAAECEAAGAAMIHIHVRDGAHQPTLDQALLRPVVEVPLQPAQRRAAQMRPEPDLHRLHPAGGPHQEQLQLAEGDAPREERL